MHKRTRACQFPKKVKQAIYERDGGCIFCRMAYHLPNLPQNPCDIMHIVNRSQGGLGIEKNGVLGCRHHHMLLDNGNKGLRSEMLEIIKNYMQGIYPDWNVKDLVYKKEEQ